MLSRSSSAYQPLGGGGGVGDNRNGGGGGGVEDDDDHVHGHEMTSIAIISQHPFRSSTQAPVISTVSGGPAATANMDDFALCAEEKGSTPWTNFHFVMCVGIIGFFVFWIILLCRMYLPPEFQFWGPGKKH